MGEAENGKFAVSFGQTLSPMNQKIIAFL